MDKIRIAIVDDHFMVRLGLTELLGSDNAFEVVAEAGSGAEAIETWRRVRPDVMILDLRLPDMSGAQACAAIRSEDREARILILSTYDGTEDVQRALGAGALGYLRKDTTEAELLAAIRSVFAGRRYLPSYVLERIAERMSQPDLTPREIEVLARIVRGRSNKEIGSELFISEATVKAHVSSILEKMGASDRAHAAAMALQKGIIHPDWT